MSNRCKCAWVGQIHEGTANPTRPHSVPTSSPRSQVRELTHKLMSHFRLHYNHLGLTLDSYCHKSVKTFSHLSCHELSKAWGERESGDEQGDEGGIHQASDRKGRAAGSLISVSVTWCVYLSFGSNDESAIKGCLGCVTQIIQLLYLISQRCIYTMTCSKAVG